MTELTEISIGEVKKQYFSIVLMGINIRTNIFFKSYFKSLIVSTFRNHWVGTAVTLTQFVEKFVTISSTYVME